MAGPPLQFSRSRGQAPGTVGCFLGGQQGSQHVEATGTRAFSRQCSNLDGPCSCLRQYTSRAQLAILLDVGPQATGQGQLGSLTKVGKQIHSSTQLLSVASQPDHLGSWTREPGQRWSPSTQPPWAGSHTSSLVRLQSISSSPA